MIIKITRKNKQRIFVKVKYDDEVIEIMKMIPGYEWDAATKSLAIPYNDEAIRTFFKLFYREKIIVDKKLKNEPSLFSKDMKIIINKMKNELTLKGYSSNTIKVYVYHIRRFISFFDKSPYELNEKEIYQYFLYLKEKENNSASYVNQAQSAVKILYYDIYNFGSIFSNIPRPKKRILLPEVLSKREVLRIIKSVDNLKHKSILCITYSAGLRVSEVVNLKIKDIDSERMMIHIRKGKGKKDRYTVLSRKALNILKDYSNKYRPHIWCYET